jgi:carbon storage regulator
MLVLSRKHGQSIVVGGEVTITVVAIGRGRVQLGVTAPFDTTVHREEIQRRIQAQDRVCHELQAAAAP